MRDILKKALEAVGEERQRQYGTPEVSMTRAALLFTVYLEIPVTPYDAGQLLGLYKNARAMETVHEDNAVDQAGYASMGMVLTNDFPAGEAIVAALKEAREAGQERLDREVTEDFAKENELAQLFLNEPDPEEEWEYEWEYADDDDPEEEWEEEIWHEDEDGFWTQVVEEDYEEEDLSDFDADEEFDELSE